jgi:hypothetical protein
VWIEAISLACGGTPSGFLKALETVNRKRAHSMRPERSGMERADGTERVPNEVCVVTEQRCYIPSILLKIRPHFRGRALAVAPRRLRTSSRQRSPSGRCLFKSRDR